MSVLVTTPGDVQFRVMPMNCKRVRIEAVTMCKDETLWAVHRDIGPEITEASAYDAIHMLLYRLAQRAQTESEG